MQAIARELEKARQNLLDLTLRNRLLNYRMSTTRTIRVLDELPAEIYDALVLQEKALEFRGTDIRIRTAAVATDTTTSEVDEAADTPKTAWTGIAGDGLQAHRTNRYLQTPYDEESLAKKLFRIYHEGRSVVEEQGYTVVHLAIGFIEWFESDDSDQARRAPLILVPCELERVAAGDFSRLKWTGEDVFSNMSLVAKFAEFGIVLPAFEEPEEKNGIDAWLQGVVTAIQRKTRWRVLSDMVLDFFSFTKFVMYKDLDQNTWPDEKKPQDHALLKSLFEPDQVATDDDGFDEREIDKRLSARDLLHIMDADPSQIAVIEDAKAGRNLVVEGPPGTGKSQTITNLIGEALAGRKTVLFVSEKMAALEVVKSRLDGAGLGPFCLELHSRKSNKKIVLEELRRSLRSVALTFDDPRMLDEHDVLKSELNRFVTELGTPIGKIGITPYELFGIRQRAVAHFARAGREILPLSRIANAADIREPDVVVAEGAIRELENRLASVRPLNSHPWRNTARATMQPHEEHDLGDMVRDCRAALSELRQAAAALSSVAAVHETERLEDAGPTIAAAEVLTRTPGQLDSTLLLNEEWNAPNANADELARKIEVLQRLGRELGDLFRQEVLSRSIAPELNEFRPLARRLFRIFGARYRKLRRELAAMYRGAAPSTAELLADVERLARFQRDREALRADSRGPALFGRHWRADETSPRDLRELAAWLLTFRRALLENILTTRAVEVATSSTDRAAIATAITRLREATAAFIGRIDGLVNWTQLNAVSEFGSDVRTARFERFDSSLSEWERHTSDLYRWAQFVAARAALRATVAAPLESAVATQAVEAEDLIPFFRASFAESLLRLVFAERPSLGGFVGEVHEQKIARFREIDRNLVKLNRARLSRKLHSERPRIVGGASKNSEAGILLGEFNRKRAHMPIRKLLSTAGGLIQKIKPCFLMSPLSVAQFLDPRSARFDLIVFDEASQVRPEDALGALLRGDQLVVMGDTRQLPPTSFFDHLVESDDTDEDPDEPQSAGISDVESILHQCARSYPSKTLNWHYRSRHESLIAISNLHFYRNELRVYPSSIDLADEIGLHLRHMPSSVYDRGKSSTNLLEAKAVVEAAVEHFRRFPGKTLGVGTFNIKQQQAILEEVELQLQRNPDIEPFFKSDRQEPFFVKNLETIQGDERDVILISVAYGRDALGRLSLNFGPVNRDGGERRLNVLISRAREKCVVFSNFRASDLPVDGTTSKGVFVLKAFLEYAETRHLEVEERPLEDADSPFEEAVEEVLRANRYDVRRQVGCAGFRVDLGVVDPDCAGRYLLGIECDGAKYHTSPVARDRDRLRQQILENLGWKIHRIWSTDWYRNRKETVDRLLRVVAEARSAPRLNVLESRHVVEDVRDSQPNEEGMSSAEKPGGTDSYRISAHEAVVSGVATDGVVEYKICDSIRIAPRDELHLVPPEHLGIAVEDIVRVEGPVHRDEVRRRVRMLWGRGRAGGRIRKAVERAIRYAVSRRWIEEDGDFLRIPKAPIVLRRRSGDPPARIDLICDQEIAEAIKLVLRTQFATSRNDLITAASRRLGILATSEATSGRIERVLDRGKQQRPPIWTVDAVGFVRLSSE